MLPGPEACQLHFLGSVCPAACSCCGAYLTQNVVCLVLVFLQTDFYHTELHVTVLQVSRVKSLPALLGTHSISQPVASSDCLCMHYCHVVHVFCWYDGIHVPMVILGQYHHWVQIASQHT